MLTLIEFLEEIERHGAAVVIPAPEVERLVQRFGPRVRSMGWWRKSTDCAVEIPIGNIAEAVKTIGNGALSDAVRQLRSPEDFAAVLDGSSAAGRLIETLADIYHRQFRRMVERFQDSNDRAEVDHLWDQISRALFE
jgi:hypothetical protein